MQKSNQIVRFLSMFLSFVLVLSILVPSASARTDSPSESMLQQKQAVANQLQLLKQTPRLHKDLENVKDEESVEVIILLSEKPVALEQGIKALAKQDLSSSEQAAVKTKVESQQVFVQKEMKTKGISFKKGHSYSTVLNGFSTTVKGEDLPKLLEIEGVQLVEPVVEVHALEDLSTNIDGQVSPAMDTSHSFLGIERIWDKGFKGKGVKVGVIDSGIDYHHPAFENIYKGGNNFIPPAGYTVPREFNDPYETMPSERPDGVPEYNGNGSSFFTSHGTHVAGIIAALGNNDYGISGLAPEVELYAYRVLGAYGSGSNAGVIAGINKAVVDGMDIINLSLGSASDSSTLADAIAVNNAMLAGTVAVSATGNSGPNRGTIGSPATAALGIAVANTTIPEAQFDAKVSVEAADYELTSSIALMGTTFGIELETQLSGDFEVVAVPGVGKPSDYEGLDLDGKVALISRGEIAFVDKIAAAKDAGAVATLIHNNSGTGPSNVFLGDDFEFIPSFDMSRTEGDALRAALASNEGTVSFSKFNVEYTAGDEVNTSSSRGPSTPHFDIKPDVSAPGTNIMSTIPMYGKENPDADYSKAFTRKTGTSMATPQVAGIAALILNANPDWNPFDVKVALSNTAKVLDTDKYDVFAQGSGRVQPYEAAFPNTLAYALDTVESSGVEVANKKGTITFGHFPELADGDISSTKQINVKNLSGNVSDYTVSVEVTKSFGDAKVTVDKPAFTLNDEQLLNVTLSASQVEAPEGSEILGYIHISDGETSLSLPFAADLSEKFQDIKNFRLSETDLSFNGDGIKDEGEIKFTLNTELSTNIITLWDYQNPEGGSNGDGTLGYLHEGYMMYPGEISIPINGLYTPVSTNKREQIPEGVYSVDFSAFVIDGGTFWFASATDGPFFVKSTPAEIVAAEEHVAVDSKYEFTGKLVDKYIDYKTVLADYDLDYDLNTKLQTTFEAKDETGNVISSGPVTLAQDGTFAFDVTRLKDGENEVTIFVEDAAGNSADSTFVISYDAPEEPKEKMSRISGIDRFQTALEISSEGWDSADTVIIARGNDFADALAGVPLAHAQEAPILLTLTNELSDGVLKEIERLGATEAIILGGKSAVSEAAQEELEKADITVTRASGVDRFATAAAIADLVAPNGSDEVVIANGLDFPDALSVASHAAKVGTPILLTQKNSVPVETAIAIGKLGVKETVVVGGKAVVSDTVTKKLPNVNRLGGYDRYETNTLIAEYYNVDNKHLYVATGTAYADALTGAVLAANTDSAVLLVHAIVPEYTSSYITKNEVHRLTIFGGESAVSAKVYKELEKLID
ncbi:S8 family serine peptidase [Sporosarcina sp. 6E9]|uniref:S8 family serine peptidase n=1 Tax=Sporosarcina sp. 6E9 TaxID=2819235 RepID=UPI001B30AFD8|nr:S8 family serine peptidase [Sporosarcina sp. 6E9]